MLKIIGDRGSGKTTALVAAFKRDSAGVLVFPNSAMRSNALRFWPELYELPTALSINVDAVIRGRTPAARLYVDEIQMCKLSTFARSCVVAWCTGTG